MNKMERIGNIINLKIKEVQENAEIFAAQGNEKLAMKCRAIAVALIDIQDLINMDDEQIAFIEEMYK